VRMSFLSHSVSLIRPSPSRLLLSLLWRRLLAGERLANTPRGAANALLHLSFGFDCRHAFCHGDMMLSHTDPQVRGTLLVAERATHRSRPQPLPARTFVHEALRNIQFIYVEQRSDLVGLALRVGDGAAQHFFDMPGSAL